MDYKNHLNEKNSLSKENSTPFSPKKSSKQDCEELSPILNERSTFQSPPNSPRNDTLNESTPTLIRSVTDEIQTLENHIQANEAELNKIAAARLKKVIAIKAKSFVEEASTTIVEKLIPNAQAETQTNQLIETSKDNSSIKQNKATVEKESAQKSQNNHVESGRQIKHIDKEEIKPLLKEIIDSIICDHNIKNEIEALLLYLQTKISNEAESQTILEQILKEKIIEMLHEIVLDAINEEIINDIMTKILDKTETRIEVSKWLSDLINIVDIKTKVDNTTDTLTDFEEKSNENLTKLSERLNSIENNIALVNAFKIVHQTTIEELLNTVVQELESQKTYFPSIEFNEIQPSEHTTNNVQNESFPGQATIKNFANAIQAQGDIFKYENNNYKTKSFQLSATVNNIFRKMNINQNGNVTTKSQLSEVFAKPHDTRASINNKWTVIDGKIRMNSNQREKINVLVDIYANSSESDSKNKRNEKRNKRNLIRRYADSLLKNDPATWYNSLVEIYGKDRNEFKDIYENCLSEILVKAPFRAIYTHFFLKKGLDAKKDILPEFDTFGDDVNNENLKNIATQIIHYDTVSKDDRENVLNNLHQLDPTTLSEFIGRSGHGFKKNKNEIKTLNFEKKLFECAEKNPSLIKSFEKPEGITLTNEQKEIIFQISNSEKGTDIKTLVSRSIASFPTFSPDKLTDRPVIGKIPFHVYCSQENEEKVFVLTLLNFIAKNSSAHFLWPNDSELVTDHNFPAEFATKLLTDLTFNIDHNDIQKWKELSSDLTDKDVIDNIKKFLLMFSYMSQLVEDIGFCCFDCSGKSIPTIGTPQIEFKDQSPQSTLSETLNIKRMNEPNLDKTKAIVNSTMAYLIIINNSLFSKLKTTQTVNGNEYTKIIEDKIKKRKNDILDLNVTNATKIGKTLQYTINLYDKIAPYDKENKFSDEKHVLKTLIHNLAVSLAIELDENDDDNDINEKKDMAFSRAIQNAALITGKNYKNKYINPPFNEKQKKVIPNLQRLSSDPENNGIDINIAFHDQLKDCHTMKLNIIVGDFGSGKTTVVNQLKQNRSNPIKIISNIEFDTATQDANGHASESGLFTITKEQEDKLKKILNKNQLQILTTEERPENAVSKCACCSGRSELVRKLIDNDTQNKSDSNIILLDSAGMVDSNGVANIDLEYLFGRIDLANFITVINPKEPDYYLLFKKIADHFNQIQRQTSTDEETKTESSSSLNEQTILYRKAFEKELNKHQKNDDKTQWFLLNKFTTLRLATHIMKNPHGSATKGPQITDQQIKVIHYLANHEKIDIEKYNELMDNNEITSTNESENVDFTPIIHNINATDYDNVNQEFNNAFKSNTGFKDGRIEPDYDINESEVPPNINQKNIDLSGLNNNEKINLIEWLDKTPIKRAKGWIEKNDTFYEFQKTEGNELYLYNDKTAISLEMLKKIINDEEVTEEKAIEVVTEKITNRKKAEIHKLITFDKLGCSNRNCEKPGCCEF